MSEAANKYFIIPTALGRAMIAEAIAAGTNLNLKMVAVGDGDYVPAEGQTALMSERARLEITDILRDPDNPAWIRVRAIIPPDVGGWRIHEVGLLAENGNLFAVGKMDGSYKPLYTDGMCKEVMLDLIIEIGAEAGVNLILDPHVIIATRQWVMEYFGPWKTLWDKHIKDRDNPHEVTIPQIPGLLEALSNGGALRFVTRAEYAELVEAGTADPETVYVIYDDGGGEGSSVWDRLNLKLDRAEYRGYPGDEYIRITPDNTAVTGGYYSLYTAPDDGWLYAETPTGTNPNVRMIISNNAGEQLFSSDNFALSGYSNHGVVVLPMSKGQQAYIAYNQALRILQFIPARKVS